MAIEHATPPLPSSSQYLPPQSHLPPSPHQQQIQHRYETNDPYVGGQSSTFDYPAPLQQPSSAGSDRFRYQRSTYRTDGQQLYDAPEPAYEDRPTSLQQSHQRFISAPLPGTHTQVHTSASTTSLPLTSYHSAPHGQLPLAHPSTPPSTTATWQTRSASFSDPWQYTAASAPSTSTSSTGHPRVSSGSSAFDFPPEFGPEDDLYAPLPPRPYQSQAQSRPRLQAQEMEYALSPPPSADKMEFEQYHDGRGSYY